MSHARARDAVQAAFDVPGFIGQLEATGIEAESVTTAADNRKTYLVRPDLGRTLSEVSRQKLLAQARIWGPRDLLILISDGLSALAAQRQGLGVLEPLLKSVRDLGWSVFPVLVVPFGRVKLQDEVGSLLGARQSLMLLGERPGLGSPDSLGAYLTWKPAAVRTDAERNCISNIRAEGLPPAQAAERIFAMLAASLSLQSSGIGLKEVNDFEGKPCGMGAIAMKPPP
jgi:ethanolamine ammonia-lyase small subunit